MIKIIENIKKIKKRTKKKTQNQNKIHSNVDFFECVYIFHFIFVY